MSVEAVAALSVPLVIAAVGLLMLAGRGNGFDGFIAGATAGLRSAIKLLPTLTALLVAVRMFNACGAVEWIARALSPVFDAVGVPAEILPLLITRPLSGSASTATYAELLSTYGADSFPAICASVIMGSSDTLIYVISVYLSSVGLARSRHAYPCATAIMLFCIFFSCLFCRIWFTP